MKPTIRVRTYEFTASGANLSPPVSILNLTNPIFPQGNDYNSSYEHNLDDDIIDLEISLNLNLSKSRAKVVIDNTNNKYIYGGNNILDINDLIEIGIGTHEGNTYTIFSGVIANMSFSLDSDRNEIILTCENLAKRLLDTAVNIGPYAADTKEAHEIVKTVIGNVIDRNQGQNNWWGVSEDYTEIEDTSTYKIPHDIEYFAKPAYEIISEMAKAEYHPTEGNYNFYVDHKGIFHWGSILNDSGASGIYHIQNGNYISLDLEYNTDETYNVLYIYGGQDLDDKAIVQYIADYSSIASIGEKERWIALPRYAKDLYKRASDESWSNSTFREYIKSTIEKDWSQMIDLYASPLWGGKITLIGTQQYDIGDVIYITAVHAACNQKRMIIKSITHKVNPKSGWITILLVQEAIADLIERRYY